ncbi:hypothetical protein HanHA300_Chr03g0089101 [Helianthus annuus]|nr:hypothetical protein HanHA300_Chr03g0089101 [Helianthus annuus]KAJ0607775.1 hypothetical protein HanHA89_Chr03g0100691 [Helianthus annuus]KAJ0767839.1 hypothetical protein HanLR1_Chr03g0094061 [Helianthus annuus]
MADENTTTPRRDPSIIQIRSCLLNKILKDNVVQNAKPLNELVKRWSVWREPRCTTRCLFVVICLRCKIKGAGRCGFGLGSAMALLAGKRMAKTGIFLDSYLLYYNLRFVCLM